MSARDHRATRRRLARAAERLALAAVVWLALSGAACGGGSGESADVATGPSPGAPTPSPVLATRKRVEIVASHPHDRGAFTQGLLIHDGAMFESTGLNGRSTVREVELETGRVLRSTALPRELFGEGLEQHEDRLVQLTWTSGIARIYEIGSLEPVGEWRYRGEGWGLCHDGERFVMSNGSDRLSFRDDDDFSEIGSVQVTLDGQRLERLNELECVDGRVYANVWQTDFIAEIDPSTGQVRSWIDASDLLSDGEAAQADVLNGIAFDDARRAFYLTGKLWPRLFEVRFVE